MSKTLRVTALVLGLLVYSMPSMAMMHGMAGMSESGMYNLTIRGLAGVDDAKGIDQKLRLVDGVEKVHVDFNNGMVMVWMKKGKTLDQELAESILEEAGFGLDDFQRPI